MLFNKITAVLCVVVTVGLSAVKAEVPSESISREQVINTILDTAKVNDDALACFHYADQSNYKQSLNSCKQWWENEDEGLAKDIAAGMIVLNVGCLTEKSLPAYCQ